LDAYILKPLDLPDPYALYGLSWDTATTRRRGLGMADFENLRENSPSFSSLAASSDVTVMQEGERIAGVLVTGNYFQLRGAPVAMGRTILPGDASAPGASPVVVLSDSAWRIRYGMDPS